MLCVRPPYVYPCSAPNDPPPWASTPHSTPTYQQIPATHPHHLLLDYVPLLVSCSVGISRESHSEVIGPLLLIPPQSPSPPPVST
eukprot:746720-Hanusia_phi.AAC.1